MQARRRFAGSESDSDTTNLLTTPTSIVVDDNNFHATPITNDIDTDDNKKYAKKWNFRNFSNNLTIQSGNAIRSFISHAISIPTELTSATTILLDNNNTKNLDKDKQYTLLDSNNDKQELIKDIDLEEETFKDNIIVMASRDRTVEFGNAIRSLQSRNISRAVNIKDPRKAKHIQSYSEFMMIAKYIGKNIASTYAKLEKLTILAKRKSLFDDRPHEIQELTYIIKGDLNTLNQQIARLQEVSKEQRKLSSGKHLISHSSNMVLALQAKLANMSTDFKQILEVRTENLKQQKSRRDQFSQSSVIAPNSIPPSVTAAKQGSLLLSEENQVSIDMSLTPQQQPTATVTSLSSSTSRVGGGSHDESHALIPVNRSHQLQQQQMLMYDESDNYLQQRAETMQNIESTIIELGGIFQQLAHMVKEQEEIVERIDTNVQDAEMNIEAAHGEILKYFQSVTKNRWLMIKIFGILIFFFVFFVIFLA